MSDFPSFDEYEQAQAQSVPPDNVVSISGQEQSAPPDPQPIISNAPPEIDYPRLALPELIRNGCDEVADYSQAPYAMIAMNAIATMSCCVQALAKVRRSHTLVCGLSLYLLILAEPNERKSWVDSMFSSPVRDYQKAQLKAMAEPLAEYEADLAAWQARIKGMKLRMQSEAKGAEDAKESEVLKKLRKELQKLQKAKPARPRVPKILLNDATIQAVVGDLVEYPVAMVSTAEGGSWLGGAAMDSSVIVTALSHINSIFSGEEIDISRVGDGSAVLEEVALTISIAVQIEVFARFLKRTGDLPRGSGFMGRVLLAQPPSTQGKRFYKDEPAGFPQLDQLKERFRELLDMQAQHIGDDWRLQRTVISLSASAKQRWIAFYDECEAALAFGGDAEEIRAEAGKAGEIASRLAGGFHVLEKGLEGEVSLEHMDSACKIMTWHLNESRRFVLSSGLSVEFSEAERVSRRLANYCRKYETYQLKMQDFQRYCKTANTRRRDEFLPVIDMLFTAKHLIHRDEGVYTVNPKLVTYYEQGY
ncbi:MAG: YfjI family protein [Thiolinea sp.]